jgi:DNA-binding CsgD family transcriptional regulator
VDDLFTFQLYRTFTGAIAMADVYRRNGRLAVTFRDADTLPDDRDPFTRYREILSANLTAVEERTWRRLLSGRSIAAIAEEEGVKRSAIYARIRGSGGKGGMIRKNVWVARWWTRRQHSHS